MVHLSGPIILTEIAMMYEVCRHLELRNVLVREVEGIRFDIAVLLCGVAFSKHG